MRRVCIVLLMLCVQQLQQQPARAELSPEEIEKKLQEELPKVSENFKRLFWRDGPLEPAEALKLLESVREAHEWAPAKIKETPFPVEELIAYAEVSEEKCAEANKVVQMRQAFEQAKSACPALMPYIAEHFTKQFELCGFHIKYKQVFDDFKKTRAKYWTKMSAFKDRVQKFTKISKDWRGKKPDNPHALNMAFTDMYEDEKRATASGGKHFKHRSDAAIKAYKDITDVVDGSRLFVNEVSPTMELATHHFDAMKDQELRDGLRHNNLYKQTATTNFEPSMSRMFADAYYDEGDKHWQAYEQWRNMWV